MAEKERKRRVARPQVGTCMSKDKKGATSAAHTASASSSSSSLPSQGKQMRPPSQDIESTVAIVRPSISASAELIPGIPNDLAMEALLRLPPHSHASAMDASLLWKIVLSSDRFYVLRRLRFPSPYLFIARSLCKEGEDGLDFYQFLELDLGKLSSEPRLLLDSSIRRDLSLVGPCNSLLLENHSLLITDNCLGLDGWMQFDLITRRCTRFQFLTPLPSQYTAKDVYLIGVQGDHILMEICIVPRCGNPPREMLSYNRKMNSWAFHGNLILENFVTIRGQIYVMTPSAVLKFNPSTTKWLEDASMSNRVPMLKRISSYRFTATHDGTLFHAHVIRSSTSSRMVVDKQEADSLEWCNVFEILNYSYMDCNFSILSTNRHIFLVMSTASDLYKCEHHHLGKYLLTCLYIPGCWLDTASLIDGEYFTRDTHPT